MLLQGHACARLLALRSAQELQISKSGSDSAKVDLLPKTPLLGLSGALGRRSLSALYNHWRSGRALCICELIVDLKLILDDVPAFDLQL